MRIRGRKPLGIRSSASLGLLAVVTGLAVGFPATTATAHPHPVDRDRIESWGDNSFGQLGDGDTTGTQTPVTIAGLTEADVQALAIGSEADHGLALLRNSTVKAWGRNAFGELGDGTNTNRHTPVTVTGLTGVRAIAAGDGHSLALLSNGTVKAWGFNNDGQLGDGTNTSRNTPVTVTGLTGVRAIAAGGRHSLALLSNGTVKAWGFGGDGQLGDGSNTNRNTPVQVCAPGQTAPCTRFLTGVRAIAAGDAYSLALLSNGTVKAWGFNNDGELGDGSNIDRNTPVTVTGLTGVRAIAAGGFHGLALLSNGTVKAWGSNNGGQLGDGSNTNRNTPVRVCAPGQTAPCTRFLDDVVAIAAGGGHSLALLSNRTLKAWGSDNRGQLGDGSNTNRNTPVTIRTGLPRITEIVAGEIHTLAA